MIHLTMVQAIFYMLGGLVALWVLRKVIPMLWALAIGLTRIAFRLGIVAVAGAELWLLLNYPPVFAAEFGVVAVAALGWRRFEQHNGYSPLIGLKRLVLRRHEPTPLEEWVEEPQVLKPEAELPEIATMFSELPDPQRPARQRARRSLPRPGPLPKPEAETKAEPIDWNSQLATWEELWTPGEWEDIARKTFGQDPAKPDLDDGPKDGGSK